jgi:hypothetical protein
MCTPRPSRQDTLQVDHRGFCQRGPPRRRRNHRRVLSLAVHQGLSVVHLDIAGTASRTGGDKGARVGPWCFWWIFLRDVRALTLQRLRADAAQGGSIDQASTVDRSPVLQSLPHAPAFSTGKASAHASSSVIRRPSSNNCARASGDRSLESAASRRSRLRRATRRGCLPTRA